MSGRLLRIIFLLLTICIPLVALAGCVGESPAPTANQPGTANYIDLGIAAHNKGDYDQAIAYYNQAITLEPTDATAFFDRASAYDAKGDDKKAAEDYSQAIKLKPDYEAAYYGRGTANLYLDNFDEAIADFDQSIKLKPINARAYTNRCIAYYHKGNYTQADADCTEAIKQADPAEEYLERTYDTRGLVHQARHEQQSAIKDFTQALQLNPKFWQSYYSRAKVYQEIGEKEKAIADYRKVLDLSNDPDLVRQARKELLALGAK